MSAFAGVLVGIHVLLAQRTGIEEWEVAPEEAQGLLTAAQNVARHYNVATTQKALDWSAFVFAAAAMYGPRVMLTVSRQKEAQKPAQPFTLQQKVQGAPWQ